MLLAARTDPTPTQLDRIEVLSRRASFEDLAKRAAALNLVSLVYETLNRVDLAIDRAALAPLRARHTQNALRNRVLSRQLVAIARTLDEARIEALTVKGVVLSALVYGSETSRELGDLDWLVHARDVEAAARRIEALGYVRTQPIPRSRVEFSRRRDVRLEMPGPPMPVVLELHWKFKDTFFQLPEEALWSNADTRAVDTYPVLTLTRTMTLVHLLHQLNYEAYPLRNLVDLAEAFRAFHGMVSYQELESLISRFSLRRNLALALDAIVEALDRELPVELREVRERLREYDRPWLSWLVTDPRFLFDERALAAKRDPRARAAFSTLFLDEELVASLGAVARRSILRKAGS